MCVCQPPDFNKSEIPSILCRQTKTHLSPGPWVLPSRRPAARQVSKARHLPVRPGRRGSQALITGAPRVEAPSGPSAVAARATLSHFTPVRVLRVKRLVIQAADKDLVFTEAERLG